MLNSQTCENFFNLLRSMTPTNSTVVQCNVNEFVHRTNKIILLEQTRSKLKDEGFVFKDNRKTDDNDVPHYTLPTTEEIYETIVEAMNEAITEMKNLLDNEKIDESYCTCRFRGVYCLFLIINDYSSNLFYCLCPSKTTFCVLY